MRSEQEIREAMMALSGRGKDLGYSCRLMDVIRERVNALAWVLRWCDANGEEMVDSIGISEETARFMKSLGLG